MNARCKFQVTSVRDFGNNCREMELNTCYDKKLSEEDAAFSKATPSGSMKMRIDNPAVFDIFQPGKYVYIDITPV